MIVKQKIVLHPHVPQQQQLLARFRVWQKIVAWATEYRVAAYGRTGQQLTPLAMAHAAFFESITTGALHASLAAIPDWPAVTDATLVETALHDAERAASHIIAGRSQFMRTTDHVTHPRLYFEAGVVYRVSTLVLPIIGRVMCTSVDVMGEIVRVKVTRSSVAPFPWVATLWIDEAGRRVPVAPITDEDAAARKQKIVQDLSRVFGVEITRVLRIMGTTISYQVDTARGCVSLRTTDELITESLFRSRVVDACGVYLPNLKKIWPAIVQSLLDICEDTLTEELP